MDFCSQARVMLLSGHHTAKQTDCSLWQQVKVGTGTNSQWDASLECMNNDQGSSDVLIAPGLQGSAAGLTPQEAALVDAGVQVANTPGQHAQAIADSTQQGPTGHLTKLAAAFGQQLARQQLGPLTNGGCPEKVAGGLQNSPNTAIQQGGVELPAATASNGHVPSCADHAAQTESDEEGPPKPKRPAGTQQCPRCSSKNTKFCYYNNYNVKQPRYYCRDCQRYWTMGGTLRQIAPGAGRRKTKAVVPTKGRTSDHDGEAAAAPMTPSEAEAALYSPTAAAAAAMPGTVQQAQMMNPAQHGAAVFSAPLGFPALTAQPQALGTATAAAVPAALVHQAAFSPASQGNVVASGMVAGVGGAAAAGGTAAAGSMGNLLAALGPAGLASVLSQQPQQLFSQGPDVLLQQVKQLLNPPALSPLGGFNPLLDASMLPGAGGMFPAAAAANLAVLMGTPEALQTAAVAAVAAAASGMDPLSSLAAIMSAITAAGQQQQQGQQQQIGAAMAALTTAGLMPKGLDLTAAAAAAVQGGPAAAAAAALGLFKPQQQQFAALAGLQSMFSGLAGVPNFSQQQQQQEAEQQLQQLQVQQLLQVMQGALQASPHHQQQQLVQQQQQQQLLGHLAVAACASDYQAAVPAAGTGAATAATAGAPAHEAETADEVAAQQPATAAGTVPRTSAASINADEGGMQPTGVQQKRSSGGIHDPALDGIGQHASGVAGADGSATGDRRVRQRVEAPATAPGQQKQQPQQLLAGAQSVQAGAACQLVNTVPNGFNVTDAAAGGGTLTALMHEAAKKEQQLQHSQQHQGTMGPPAPHKISPQHKLQHLQQQQQHRWPDIAQQLQQQLLMQQVQSAVGGPATAIQQQFQQLQQKAQLQAQQAQQQLQQQAWLRQSTQATAAGTAQWGGIVNPDLLTIISQLVPQGISQGPAPALGGTGAAVAEDGLNDAARVGNMQQQQQQQLPPAGQHAYAGFGAADQLAAAVQAQAAAMQLAQAQPSTSVAAPQQAATAMDALQVLATGSWDAAGPAAAAGSVGLAQYSAGPWLAGKQSWEAQLQTNQPQGSIKQEVGAILQQQHIHGQAAEAAVTGAVGAAAGNGWSPQTGVADTTAAAAASYMAQQMAAAAAAYPDLM